MGICQIVIKVKVKISVTSFTLIWIVCTDIVTINVVIPLSLVWWCNTICFLFRVLSWHAVTLVCGAIPFVKSLQLGVPIKDHQLSIPCIEVVVLLFYFIRQLWTNFSSLETKFPNLSKSELWDTKLVGLEVLVCQIQIISSSHYSPQS